MIRVLKLSKEVYELQLMKGAPLHCNYEGAIPVPSELNMPFYGMPTCIPTTYDRMAISSARGAVKEAINMQKYLDLVRFVHENHHASALFRYYFR